RGPAWAWTRSSWMRCAARFGSRAPACGWIWGVWRRGMRWTWRRGCCARRGVGGAWGQGGRAGGGGGAWRAGGRGGGAVGGGAGAVELRDAALSVSAPHGRLVESGNGFVGHVLDPRVGAPVRGAELAWAVCESGAWAEVWSKAMLVLGRRAVGMPSSVEA